MKALLTAHGLGLPAPPGLMCAQANGCSEGVLNSFWSWVFVNDAANEGFESNLSVSIWVAEWLLTARFTRCRASRGRSLN